MCWYLASVIISLWLSEDFNMIYVEKTLVLMIVWTLMEILLWVPLSVVYQVGFQISITKQYDPETPFCGYLYPDTYVSDTYGETRV